jgi:penicillin-binding protein 1A
MPGSGGARGRAPPVLPMSVEALPDIPAAPPPRPPAPPAPPAAVPPTGRTRLKRLRFLAILAAVLVLGAISFAFGVFVSIASDLPSLTRFSRLKNAQSSVLLDDFGRPIGVLSEQNRVIVTPAQIPPVVKDAVISIEDRRFWTNSGVDVRGIARAFEQDILHSGAVQGASTIEEQFIKNALQAQSHRTVFEKMREAALAYELSHKWSKQKILAAYLNTIYFGNGAYGIEAAAQTYFGHEPALEGCGTPGQRLCVEQLKPWQAALLAGIIQAPSAYDPATSPAYALRRRNTVLGQMLGQGYISRAAYRESVAKPLPTAAEIQAPEEPMVEGTDTGYFTSWVDQQVIERYGARAFYGGLRVKTTLDLQLQRAAEQAVEGYLAYSGDPSGALVAIENSTGDVRALVGGRNYDETPFDLATQGERQPGSSFKAFDLAAALEDGISPYSEWTSAPKVFTVPGPDGVERFSVHNDQNAYAGVRTLLEATAYSDNSVFAEVGLHVGTARIAQLAHKMGIRTPISTNPAMTIGGLKVGVSPLDMAHAYETLAAGGNRVGSSMVADDGPNGIQEVAAPSGQVLPDGHTRDVNQVQLTRVMPAWVASTETSMLESVLEYGTAKAAAIGQFAAGKTGTTSNFSDAWFVGWDSKYTVAVWVGYPNSLVSMATDFNGGPVEGGTYPALIWHDFMLSALRIDKTREEEAAARTAGSHHGQGSGLEESATSVPSSGASVSAAPGHEEHEAQHRSPAPGATTQQGSAPVGTTQHGSAPATPAAPQTPASSAPSSSPTPSATPESAAPPTSTPAPSTSAPNSPGPTPKATGGVGPGG